MSEPGVFGSLKPEPIEKNQEPEPLGKKSRAGASNKLAAYSALLEDKKHKEIVLFYSSLGKMVSFIVKQLFYLFYIFCSFTY